MAKFKKADRVRLARNDGYNRGFIEIGTIGTVNQNDNAKPWVLWDKGPGDRIFAANEENLEALVEGGAPMARKTYKLKKDTPTVRKGAIFQEACDDGTQEYIVLTPDLVRDSRGKSAIFDRTLVEEQPTWFEEVFKVEPEYMTREELDQWEAFKVRKKAQPTKTATTKHKGPYKVGDVVRLRDDLKVDFAYGGAFWNEEMVKFAGQSVKIERIISKGFYKIEDDESNWSFTDSMFVGQTDVRKKRTWTDEQRAAHGAKIKAAHQRKKAAAKRAA